MLLECRTCPACGDACRDCLVSALVDGPPVALDPRESGVVAQFLAAGLVAPEHAAGLRARLAPVGPPGRVPLAVGRAG
ncbi:hypothetical protein [Arsenicicoccus dermatophilus]|uniref:hypothetical protein n=1 Tax=Arsenicicoccus dermatophilus TaxID=1076331 RepID=UPI001F4C84F2|nr:hypothetical protein [Arsenicicoccus dermatophilus]MCH8612664.1 hypothetical protein [Arsenicicoccus dermatophilus]